MGTDPTNPPRSLSPFWEKFVFALAVAVLTTLLTFLLDRSKIVWGMQENLFERRFAAYQTIAESSNRLLDEMEIRYSARVMEIRSGLVINPETVGDLRFSMPGSPRVSGGLSTFNTIEDMISRLEEFEKALEEYRWLNSDPVNSHANEFRQIVFDSIYADIVRAREEDAGESLPIDHTRQAEAETWAEIQERHHDLEIALRSTLGIDAAISFPSF